METNIKGERNRVMIADSSTFIRVMLTTLTTGMEKLGFEVVGTAKNGREAVDKYMELKPDMVFVDAALEEIDGIEVTRMIMDQNPSAFVTVLIDESLDLSDLSVKAVRAGAKGYLKKPLTLLDSPFLAHGSDSSTDKE